MKNHLEEHQHAFIDENNIVINVAIFDESAHGSQLLEDLKVIHNAKEVICCCDYGIANIGWEWTGTNFKAPKPTPIQLTGDDGSIGTFIWDEELQDLKQID